MSAKIDFTLYLISDRHLFADRKTFLDAIRKSLEGGIRAIQLREKDLHTRPLLELAYRMRDVTGEYGAKLFINDRFDIALAVDADGVHLTQDSIPADSVRKTVKNKLLIGISTHSMKEAKRAERGGADFITLGPVYKTPSKLRYGNPVGLDVLRQASSYVKIPVFAIGGISTRRVKEIKEAGAFGAAMIREILCAKNIFLKTRELSDTK